VRQWADFTIERLRAFLQNRRVRSIGLAAKETRRGKVNSVGKLKEFEGYSSAQN